MVSSNLKTNNAGKFNKPYLWNGNYIFKNVVDHIAGTCQFYEKVFLWRKLSYSIDADEAPG